MPGESVSTHDEYQCRYIRGNNDTGTRHWQRSHTLDLVRNLTQPLIQLTCQRASIARVPRACVRSFPGRHSETLPISSSRKCRSSGRWSFRAVVTVVTVGQSAKRGRAGRRHSGVGADPTACRTNEQLDRHAEGGFAVTGFKAK